MVTKLVTLLILFLDSDIMGYKIQDAPLLTKRPPWLKVCRKSAPNINKCLDDLFAQMFPYLATGIPEINVEHFEPLLLDKVSITKGSGPIILTGSFEDLHIVGSANATPHDIDLFKDGSHGHWNFGIDVPTLDIKSIYNLKGHILVLPLHGHGNSTLKLHNVRTKCFNNVSFPLKEGREIVHIDSMKVNFKVGAMKIKLDNLFNGNKILGHTVNAFINQNGLEIISELEETLGESLAQTFTKLINNIFTKIPLDLWYLNDEQYQQYEKEAN